MGERAGRPFPAMTPSERLHLDVFGYVLIEQAISPDETDAIRDRLYGLESDFRTTGSLPAGVTSHFSSTEHFFRIDNLPHVDPVFLSYLTHPRLVGLAEEAVGGEVRLEQSDAHIRRPPSDPAGEGYGFHRGAFAGLSYTQHGLYHYPFVKTLTNLTDLGPEDGGTVVIPGSHKLLDCDVTSVIEAAMDDPSLIHQVEAPAGSTLLFFESLIHSSGIIRSGRDRLLIIGGYTPTMFQPWQGYDPDPALMASVPEEVGRLLDGSARWAWRSRFRELSQPAAPVGGPSPTARR